jgi:NTP pyrophosphatase (non-canonical NTP hydrolase)
MSKDNGIILNVSIGVLYTKVSVPYDRYNLSSHQTMHEFVVEKQTTVKGGRNPIKQLPHNKGEYAFVGKPVQKIIRGRNMNFNDYQKLAKTTDKGSPINYYFLGLSEEVGETLGLRKRILRGDKHVIHDELRKELGDALWYLTMIADRHGMTLEEVAVTNIEKLEDRRKRNVILGNGSNR